MTEKLIVKNLYKVFGPRPEIAMRMLGDGLDPRQIFAETGMQVAVRDATFTVRSGEIFVVMGLSGSGKSTLVRMLNRLIEPTAGQVLVDGRDVTQMTTPDLIRLRRQDMSMVFQSFALMPHLTVLENAAFGLEVAGMAAAERRERAAAALAQVGLDAHADRYPHELSGGMQQRVGLARALARDPSIMLMDEAFSALDPLIRTEMQDELLKLQEKEERTIIFISHDIDEAMRIGDRIAIMESGGIVQVDSPADMVQRPVNDYVRSFFRRFDVSQVLTAGDIAAQDGVLAVEVAPGPLDGLLRRLEREDRQFAYVFDRNHRFRGVVSRPLLESAVDDGGRLSDAFVRPIDAVPATAPVNEILVQTAQSQCPLPVIDEAQAFLGVISKEALLESLAKGR